MCKEGATLADGEFLISAFVLTVFKDHQANGAQDYANFFMMEKLDSASAAYL